MTIRNPRIRRLAQSSFRFSVGISAAFLVLWIATMSLNAIVADPQMIVAVWLLGIAGWFACTGACISTFPSPGQGDGVPHPKRALLCLAGGAVIALVLWSQARPVIATKPLGVEALGVVLSAAVVLGLLLLLLLPLVLLSADNREEEEGVLQF